MIEHLYRGLCFFTNEAAPGGRHLYFLVTGPHAGRIVMANVSSVACFSGFVCVVKAGEHAGITHTSHLRFKEARAADGKKVLLALNSNVFRQTADAKAILITKLAEALQASDAVAGEVIDLIKLDRS